MDRITLDMTPGEAILVTGVLEKAAGTALATWSRLRATDAPADEEAAALVAVQVLARVHARLDALVYRRCAWLAEDPCDRLAATDAPYCRLHLGQTTAALV